MDVQLPFLSQSSQLLFRWVIINVQTSWAMEQPHEWESTVAKGLMTRDRKLWKQKVQNRINTVQIQYAGLPTYFLNFNNRAILRDWLECECVAFII